MMELQALHRELWLGELARTGSHDKEPAIRKIIGNRTYNIEMENDTTLYRTDCPACQEAQDRMGERCTDRCQYCPLDWGKVDCCRTGSAFIKWCHALEDVLERKMWAMQIGFMEWR